MLLKKNQGMIWDRKTVEYLEMVSEPICIKMHIYNYGYYESDAECGKWCKVSIELKADDWLYFKCDEMEILETDEIDDLIELTDRLLRKEVKEPEEISFYEPALRIKAYQSVLSRNEETFFYMEWTVYDTVRFTLYKEEIRALNKYLKRVRAGITEPEEDQDKNKRVLEIYAGHNDPTDVFFYSEKTQIGFSVSEEVESELLETILAEYFDKSLAKNIDREDFEVEFDPWGKNYYTREGIRDIGEEVLNIAYLMETDFENYGENEMLDRIKRGLSTFTLCDSGSQDYGEQSSDSIKRNIDVAVSFYRRFALELEELLEHMDTYDMIVVEGP